MIIEWVPGNEETEQPYHIRGTYNAEDGIIEIVVLDKRQQIQTIRIRDAYLLLGHPKTDTCCQPAAAAGSEER